MRFLFTALTLFVLANFCYAQNSNKINLSLQFGVNTSYFNERIGPYGDGEEENFSNYVRISPKIGFGLQYNINKVVSILSEVNYTAQGGSYRQENNSVIHLGGDGSEKAFFYKNYRVNYIEIPLLLSINISNLINKEIPDDKLNVLFSSGMALSFNTTSSLRYNGFEESGSSSGPLTDVTEEYDVVEIGYGKNNLSYICNIGFKFSIKQKVPAFVNLRYQQTVFNVYSVERLEYYNMATKMGTASISFGVVLNKN